MEEISKKAKKNLIRFLISFLVIVLPLVFSSPIAAQSDGDAAAAVFTLSFIVVYLLCFAVIAVISGLLFALWIYQFIDVFQRDFGDNENMAIAGILLLLIGGIPIGQIIYYFLIMKQYPKK
jgi:uncharacterized membrane protein